MADAASRPHTTPSTASCGNASACDARRRCASSARASAPRTRVRRPSMPGGGVACRHAPHVKGTRLARASSVWTKATTCVSRDHFRRDPRRAVAAARRLVRTSRLNVSSVLCPGSRRSRLLLFRGQHQWRTELDGQLVDLAVEGERHLVVLVVDPAARVDTDVEGLVGDLQEGDGVGLLARWRRPCRPPSVRRCRPWRCPGRHRCSRTRSCACPA